MKLLAPVLALSVLTSAAFAAPRIERVVEKAFTVTGNGTVRVETQGGEIRVMPGAEGQVQITARQKIRAGSEAEADELLKKLEMSLTQNGNDVTAVAKYERQPSGFAFRSWPPVSVDFIVTVPAGFAGDVNTSGGAIHIGDLKGKLQARTSGGSIRLGKLGGEVHARTSGGNISLESANAAVELDTSGGNITVGGVQGPAKLSTSGGNIRIESAVGSVQARTSGGNIRAAVMGTLKDDCVFSTSGGSVNVTVDKAAGFQLDASTSGGGVEAEGLTIRLEKGGSGKSRLSGAVNGGGPLLKLRSSGGSIQIAAK